MYFFYPIPEVLPQKRARFVQIFNTCEALSKFKVKVEICCALKKNISEKEIANFYNISLGDHFIIKKFPLLSIRKNLPLKITLTKTFYLSLLKYLWKISKNINTKKILFLRYPKLAYFLLKFKKFWNYIYIYEAHEPFFLKNKKFEKIEKEIFKNADVIVFITQNLKNLMIKNFKITTKNVHIIPDAVKDNWLNIASESPEYIFYAGSLEKWKGIEILIKAMKFLPNEKLVIAGEGKEMPKLKDLVKKLGLGNQIKFLGFIPHHEIPKYLTKAKVLVLPNIETKESLFSSPLKLFEYMATGIPIIASNITSFKEILIHKKNAYLVEPNNPLALAKGIKTVINDADLAKKIGINAKREAINFTYSARAKKIIDTIQNLK